MDPINDPSAAKPAYAGMSKGWRLENSMTIRSVTSGIGTKDESRNADKNRPTGPSAGSVDFSPVMNWVNVNGDSGAHWGSRQQERALNRPEIGVPHC
jgi:hypothetical protein